MLVDYMNKCVQVAIWRDPSRRRLVVAFRGTEQVCINRKPCLGLLLIENSLDTCNVSHLIHFALHSFLHTYLVKVEGFEN